MPKGTCEVEGCTSAIVKRQWCERHYRRWYDHGDPAYERPCHVVCTIEGCAKPTRSGVSGLCEMHYIRRYRHGDPLAVVDTRLPLVAYRAAHARLQVDLGPATTYPCVDCGHTAAHWSYDRSDPDELTSPGGQAYSLDPARYAPRCRSCHARFDGTGFNQYSGPRTRDAVSATSPGGWNDRREAR